MTELVLQNQSCKLIEDNFERILEKKVYLEKVIKHYEKEIVRLKQEILRTKKNGIRAETPNEIVYQKKHIKYYIEIIYDTRLELNDIHYVIGLYEAEKCKEIEINAFNEY